MTDISAPVQLVTDETADQANKPAQRVHGIKRLREDECYHITGLICDSLTEAQHLIHKVHSRAYGRTLDYDGTKGTKPIDVSDFGAIFDETHECLSLAMTYLTSLNDNTPRKDELSWDDPLPPF